MRETFTGALKQAMKAGNKPRVSVIRLMQAGLKDRDIEARGQGKGPIPDDEILSMIQKMIKQANESLETAQKARREDLVAGSRQEIEILTGFLPQQMDAGETEAAIRAAIAETGAEGAKDMGKVMAALKGRYAGRMDFGRASPLVKQALTS